MNHVEFIILKMAVATAMLVTVIAGARVADNQWDVVVYGSTPSGIAAATAAGRLGLKVALYEPLKMIGGMGGKL